MMNFMKFCLTGGLIDPYVCKPTPLKQQMLRHIALQLQDNSSIRRQIFYPEVEIVADSSAEQVRAHWEKSFSEVLTKVVETLLLPQTLQKELIDLIQSMALQLLIWSGEWKDMFDIPSNFTANLWLPTDWIESRLYERKIAERIMENDKLTADQRYRVACMYCLEEFISSLWNELSPEMRESYVDGSPDELPKSSIITIWSVFLDEPESFTCKEELYGTLYRNAIHEYRPAVFIFCWYKFSEDSHYEKVFYISESRSNYDNLFDGKKQVLPFKDNLNIQLPKSSGHVDIVCFFLMKAHEYKVSEWKAKLKYREPIVKYFLEWPREDFVHLKHM